jgi:hypothetical protein
MTLPVIVAIGVAIVVLGAEVGYLLWERREARRDERSKIRFWVKLYSLTIEWERRHVQAETKETSKAA